MFKLACMLRHTVMYDYLYENRSNEKENWKAEMLIRLEG